MEINRYHVDCPVFGQVDIDYRKQKRTVREYCHPVDEKIIRKLDNPAVNAVFKTLIDVNVDQQFGQMLATGIPVNQQNYPREDEMLRQCSEILGIRRPYAIISGSEAGINAFTTGSDEEPYLILTSLLVKTLSTEQLKFVIGHECGHIAMGHVVYHSAVNAAGSFSRLIPLIGPVVYNFISFPMKAWERRSEITADRAGPAP
ncbi:MAG: M48 family metallopeptidase [Blautia sp.]|nr:M48 family metallopeptidase [Blautia sp.]